MHIVVSGRQQQIRCPKCQNVLAVRRPPKRAVKRAASSGKRSRLAAAALLALLLLAGLAGFLLYGGPGEEALIGRWLHTAGTDLPGGERGIAIDFQRGGAWAGSLPGWSHAGTWKIVKKAGRTLTVELANGAGSTERVEVTVAGAERLWLSFPGETAGYELQRSTSSEVPGLASAAKTVQAVPQAAATASQASGQGANYSLIEARLYMGGLVPQPPPRTQGVINLCEKQDSWHRKVRAYLWVPIPDAAPAPRLDWLREMVRIVHVKRRAGQTVFVHCRAGVSRSGLVVVGYCMFEHHWSRNQALAFVRSKRPQVDPNPAFMKLLSDWEAYLREHPDCAANSRLAVR
jgi:hypothetical protein